MDKNCIIGATTALITPFKNGNLDEQGYARLIKRQIQNGIDAIVPVGMTGESATLTHEEYRICIEIAVDICKGSKIKVLAGAGSNVTHEVVGLAQFAQKCGANRILSVTPYYNKPTQEGLYQHHKAIASSVEIPVLLYNVPGKTSCEIATDTAIRLFRDCENIYDIKEASGNIDKCVDLLAHEPRLVLTSGDDMIDYPILSNGGKGITSISSNLPPDRLSKLTKRALNEDYKAVKKINDKLYNINKVLFCESNLIPIRVAMFIAGLIEKLEFRLPLRPPSKENFAKIEAVMKHYEIKGF